MTHPLYQLSEARARGGAIVFPGMAKIMKMDAAAATAVAFLASDDAGR